LSTKKPEKNFNDLLFDYQTRLQGVANDLGDKLARLISTTDADVLKLIVKELPRREKNVRAEIRRLERLVKKSKKYARRGSTRPANSFFRPRATLRKTRRLKRLRKRKRRATKPILTLKSRARKRFRRRRSRTSSIFNRLKALRLRRGIARCNEKTSNESQIS
jgi:hypothetical protein